MRDRLEQHYIKNFDMLVKRYDRRAGGVMNAEDIVQEGYTNALQYSTSYDKARGFEEWLGTIINNAYKKFKSLEFPRSEPEEEAGGESADDLHYQRTQAKVIVDAIESFDQPRRDILWLWYIKQYSRGDIHKVLDVPKNTIKTVVRRFKEQMRESYENV